jgi:hypothetical protein
MPAQMKLWSMAMNRGEADLDMPPPDLAKTLMPAKSGTKNPFRNPDSNSSTKSSINSTPPPTPTPTPYPYLPPPYAFYMNSYGPPQPQTPTSTPVNMVLSSPIIEGYDPVEKLIEYIGWLASRSPQQADVLFKCKEALISNEHNFNTIEKISDSQFERMKIPDGVVIDLRSQWKRFEKKTRNYSKA